MNSPSSPTNVIENNADAPPEVKLRLTCDDTPNTSADPATVFSSIKQTAVALATAASGQAIQRAHSAARAATGMRDAIAEAEQLEYAVQRANANQARRVADCVRAAFDALVRHTMHPCIALDTDGRIVRWNAAMTDWTGIAEEAALNQLLGTIFDDRAASAIEEASAALRDAENEPGGVDADPVFIVEGVFALNGGASAGRISLLPLCRGPRVVEEIVILITPLSSEH